MRHVARLVVNYFASHRLVVDHSAYAAYPGASARRAARRATCRRLLRLLCASECRGSSRSSSLTTSPTPHVRVPRHAARLVVNYLASHRLIVDYSAYATRPGASARRTARRAARRRLLRLRRASRYLDTSRGSSSTTASTPHVRVPRHVARLVVNYSAYVVCPGASARRAARHRLLRLRCASGHLGTSRGSSCSSSSTTSPMLCIS
jgi:hypothetical protein